MKIKNVILFFIAIFAIPFHTWSSEKESSGIPTVIHFVYGIWDTTPMPEYYAKTIQLWKKQGWKVKLWNKTDIENLLSRPEYQGYQETYNQLPRNIQKADFIRYLIVYDQGGFYFDLDCRPSTFSLLDELSPILSSSPDIFFIGREHPPKRLDGMLKRRIANFAFGTRAKSSLLEKILELATQRCAQYPGPIIADSEVLYTTGPHCVSDIINYTEEPFTLIKNTKDYLQHTCTGTWREFKDKGKRKKRS